MFSSRSFIVSGLTFRSLIHFELIFVYGVRKCSSFILLQMVDQFSQHHLLKRLSFFHCITLPPLLKIKFLCNMTDTKTTANIVPQLFSRQVCFLKSELMLLFFFLFSPSKYTLMCGISIKHFNKIQNRIQLAKCLLFKFQDCTYWNNKALNWVEKWNFENLAFYHKLQTMVF